MAGLRGDIMGIFGGLQSNKKPADNNIREDDINFKNRNVLVGVIRGRHQFNAMLKMKFYHIPISRVNDCSFPVEYVAVYQSKKHFGRKSGVRIYGEVESFCTVPRNKITEIPKDSSEKYIYLFCFLPDELSTGDALSLIKKVDYSSKQIVLFSNAFSKNLIDISNALKISLISTEKIYSNLKESYPEFLDNLEILDTKKFKFSGLFQKKNGIRFILYGSILELLSLITFFPIYYVLSGAVFIIYGLITLFFGNTVKQPSIDLDDILNEKPKSIS